VLLYEYKCQTFNKEAKIKMNTSKKNNSIQLDKSILDESIYITSNLIGLGCGTNSMSPRHTNPCHRIPINTIPHVKQIIFSNPVTTVIWADGDKTQVRCHEGDVFDEDVGFALNVVKKLYGRQLYDRMMKRAKR
jgi:hypothetical protein